MKVLFIPNDPPYGTECCYNALRGMGLISLLALVLLVLGIAALVKYLSGHD